MMKRILFACMALAFSLVASAQNIMVVSLNNGETQEYNVSEVNSVSFKVGQQEKLINGHEYVDLGLSVMWATCNVGSKTSYGNYYAWGETNPKSDYSWSTYKSCKGTKNTLTKYCTDSDYGTVDNKTALELNDDVARVNWGGTWRMPTYAELTELREKCTWTWTTKNGMKGYEVKSKINGNTIFLPAAGFRENSRLDGEGSYGYYWSSSLQEIPIRANSLYINPSVVLFEGDSRYKGLSVRPVCSVGAPSTPTCSFSTSTHTLNVGETYTQIVTTNSDGAVTYKSSNPSVATVDASTGKVTAVAAGNVTITATVAATSTYASASAAYNIIVVKATTHEYVDLGLSVKWATCNVGATTPEGYGDYFAWGETQPKSNYSWSTLKYCCGTTYQGPFSKYCKDSDFGTVDNKTILELTDDAARVNWGGTWRMPTTTEQQELLNNCYWEWTTSYNGVSVNGYIVYKVKSDSDKGKIKYRGSSTTTAGSYSLSDTHLFLPAAGCRYDTSLSNAGSHGYYWSSSLATSYSYDAYGLYFYSSDVGWYSYYRCRGRSVRPVCSIGAPSIPTCSFSTSTHTLNVGETYTQIVTTNSDGAVTYKSSNPSVATVDASTGKVTAIAEGNTTITATVAATSTYASASASYNIIVIKSSASTHEYVDLGLSVKWATCNVGATKPEGYGDYFAWGETQPKSNYSWSTYKWCKGSENSQTKYCTVSSYGTVDNKTTLEMTDDAARANWGGSWRMPTSAELDELSTKCLWTWTFKNGVKGYEVKSMTNGNSIFLPAAGYLDNGALEEAGSEGRYWSSTLDKEYPNYAFHLHIYKSNFYWDDEYRSSGVSVRAVCP